MNTLKNGIKERVDFLLYKIGYYPIKMVVNFIFYYFELYRIFKYKHKIAYLKALRNLEISERFKNKLIVGMCAYCLGRASHKYQPVPKIEDAIKAYKLATNKFLAFIAQSKIVNRKGADINLYVVCIRIQAHLGNAYIELQTGRNDMKICSEQ